MKKLFHVSIKNLFKNTSVRNISSWNLLVSLIKYEETYQCGRKLLVQKSALLLVGSREFDHLKLKSRTAETQFELSQNIDRALLIHTLSTVKSRSITADT